MEKKYKYILIVVVTIVGILVVISGTTFAYLSASANNKGISGATKSFKVNLTLSTIKSGNLVPVVDTTMLTSLNSGTNSCVDSRGYSLCSIYQINLSNSGDAQELYGFLQTNSTTYTTNNLKYRLFTKSGNNYTGVTDNLNISIATNTENYFKTGGNNYNFSIPANGSLTYYLVIWLSDNNTNQSDDINKTYSGVVGFRSTTGNTITSKFLS